MTTKKNLRVKRVKVLNERAFAILNCSQRPWTMKTFSDEHLAWNYLNDFWRGNGGYDRSCYMIVPCTITYAIPAKGKRKKV